MSVPVGETRICILGGGEEEERKRESPVLFLSLDLFKNSFPFPSLSALSAYVSILLSRKNQLMMNDVRAD